MGKKTTRERLRKRRRRERLRSRIIWGGIVVVVLVLGGTLIWRAVRPAAVKAFPIMASSRHVPVGEDPGPFNSDPPTSGPHYDAPLEAGQEWSELFKDTIPYAAETAMEIDTRYQLGYPQHSSLE